MFIRSKLWKKFLNIDLHTNYRIVISNNGTLIYSYKWNNEGIIGILYFNDPNIYTIHDVDYKPIYIDNENGELFVESGLGIRKLCKNGDELVFKFAGFDKRPKLYYGNTEGKSSSIVDAVGNDSGVREVIDLSQY